MNKPKDKRGKQFLIVETGELVTLNRIKENGEYFVDYPNGNYASFDLSDLREAKPNKASSISNKSKKLTEWQKSDKQKLTDFFDGLKVPDKCQECGQKLITYNKFARRSVCCHILPKRSFESIAMNPLNILFMGADFLGGCCDHDIFDNSVSNRIKMNVYPLVLERFDMLKPLLTSSETLKAMEYLGIPITQEILKELK